MSSASWPRIALAVIIIAWSMLAVISAVANLAS